MRNSTALFLTSSEQNISAININSLSSASGRMQLRPAVIACTKYGLRVRSILPDIANPDVICINDKPAICFVGKISATTEAGKKNVFMATLAAIATLKAQQVPIACIYSDHFDGSNKLRQDLQKTLLSLADCHIFPSKKLANMVQSFLEKKKKRFIIYDPIQIKPSPFPGKIQKNARLIWFGHDSNIKYLLQCLGQLQPIEGHNYELTILTSKHCLLFYKNFLEDTSHRLKWKMRMVIWEASQQPSQLQRELDRAQISLIPSDASDPKKAGVSHNRLTDSIQGGCITIASPIESYKELSKLAILGEDFQNLIQVAISQSERLSQKYAKLRSTFLQDFEESQNLDQWKMVISYLATKGNA